MANHSKGEYIVYVYRYIQRIKRLFTLLITEGETIDDAIFYGSILLSFVKEVLKGIRDNDFEGYQRLKLDELTPEFRQGLTNARDSTFHFAENIIKAKEQESSMTVDDIQFSFVINALTKYANDLMSVHLELKYIDEYMGYPIEHFAKPIDELLKLIYPEGLGPSTDERRG